VSKKHPECPLYNPLNCKEYYIPKLCAFVRKDKICLKKKKPKPKKADTATPENDIATVDNEVDIPKVKAKLS